jgi:hypothetical protein
MNRAGFSVPGKIAVMVDSHLVVHDEIFTSSLLGRKDPGATFANRHPK